MWGQIRDKFYKQRERVNVVRKMVELGIRVRDDQRLCVGDVEVNDTALASAVGVDRRVVRNTVRQIMDDTELRIILTKVKPIGVSLVDVAERLGYGVLVVSADPHKPGVISGVTAILADYKVVIRQALADDPDLIPEPRLTLVVHGKIPPEAITKIQALPFVKSLSLVK